MVISLRAWSLRTLSSLTRRFDGRFVTGLLGGAWLFAAWQEGNAALGSSPLAAGLWLWMIALSLATGWWTARQPGLRRHPELVRATASLALATWIACLPSLWVRLAEFAKLWSPDTLESVSGGASFAALVAFGGWAIPAFAFGMMVQTTVSQTPQAAASDDGRRLRHLLLGVGIGNLCAVLFAAPWLGTQLTATVGTAILAAWALAVAIDRTTRTQTTVELPLESAPEFTSHEARPAASPSPLFLLVGMALLGLLLAGLKRTFDQFTLSTAALHHAWWSLALLGAVGGHRWLEHSRAKEPDCEPAVARSLLVTLAWSLALVAGFSWIVVLMLRLNATVTSPALLTAARLLVMAAFVMPTGWSLGALCAFGTRRSASAVPLLLAAPLVGASFGPLLLHLGGGMSILLLLSGWGLGALAGVMVRRTFERRWSRASVLTTALLCIVVAAPVLARGYQPALAARLLFNTQALIGQQNGVERSLLTQLDETRLVARLESAGSVQTLWRSRGSQLQLRENGVPRGHLSSAPAVLPHYSGELALAAIPLTLHEAPHRVLLLGTGCGTPLVTTLAFPVQTAECVEPSRSLLNFLAEHAWPSGSASPLADDRLTVRALEPAIALRAAGGVWDVILSNPRHSATHAAASEFTVEFYRAAARRLNTDGLFCQRFLHVDYGPEAVLTAVQSLRSAFRTVTALECAGGELLLLGTNSELGIVRDGFMARLQSDHVRRVLAQTGWDWVTPLNLAAYNQEALEELTKNSFVNSVANGRFSFRLPPDLARWGDKPREVAERIAPKATRFLAWPNIDARDPDLLVRLGEVAGQRNLMTGFTDQPWTYRKSLREQMLVNKKSFIRQVSATSEEGAMHPVDLQRKNYLEALGECLRADEPSEAELKRLEEQLSPYDPLVSYFAHYELAELHARRTVGDRTAELEHRLHLTWYSDARDQSIRQIVRSLELLRPDQTPGLEPAVRWDQTNALLQLLISRWELRGNSPPAATEVALKDIELSLAATEAALNQMEQLVDSVGQSAADWTARRIVVERALVRPLRTYRSRLLPLVFSEERKTNELLDKAGVRGPRRANEEPFPELGF